MGFSKNKKMRLMGKIVTVRRQLIRKVSDSGTVTWVRSRGPDRAGWLVGFTTLFEGELRSPSLVGDYGEENVGFVA